MLMFPKLSHVMVSFRGPIDAEIQMLGHPCRLQVDKQQSRAVLIGAVQFIRWTIFARQANVSNSEDVAVAMAIGVFNMKERYRNE